MDTNQDTRPSSENDDRRETEASFTPQEKANMATIHAVLETWSGKRSPDGLGDLVHQGFVNHFAPEGQRDFASFVRAVKGMRGAMKSFDAKAVLIFAKGDYVAMLDESSGEHANGPWAGTDLHIFRFKEGKMFEHWNSFGLDNQGQKLGRLMSGAR